MVRAVLARVVRRWALVMLGVAVVGVAWGGVALLLSADAGMTAAVLVMAATLLIGLALVERRSRQAVQKIDRVLLRQQRAAPGAGALQRIEQDLRRVRTDLAGHEQAILRGHRMIRETGEQTIRSEREVVSALSRVVGADRLDAVVRAETQQSRHDHLVDRLADIGAQLADHRGRLRDLERLQQEGAADDLALADLSRVLPLEAPLPLPTTFSAAATTIHALVGEILGRDHPVTVVECGSGASTVWMAAACRRSGGGRVIALEHDERYAAETRRALHSNGLDGVAEVRWAPLEEVVVAGGSQQWFAKAAWADLSEVDVLFVDGPPASTGKSARFPALPCLARALAADALVLLDDIHRADEADIARRWREIEAAGGRLGAPWRAGRAQAFRWTRQHPDDSDAT